MSMLLRTVLWVVLICAGVETNSVNPALVLLLGRTTLQRFSAVRKLFPLIALTKLLQVLDQETVKQITGIPIPVSNQRDECIWGPATDGRFSIKLKTTDRLSKFGYIDDNSCPLCDNDNETADHLFGHCDFTTEVFRLVGISAPMDWHKGYLKVLREMFINQPYDKFLFAKVLIIYWQIWKARNDTIFRDVITTATNVVATAAFHFNETALYKAVVGGGISQTTPSTIRWLPPHNNFIKINFDGSVQGRSAVGGFVFRNSDGNVILAAAKGLGSTTIPTAEATALRDNLVKARDRGYMNVQVEGDSKLVIDAINGKLSPPWRLQKIVQDIRTIATSFSSVCFNHVYREANFVADAFANEGHQLPNGREWQDGYSAAVAKALVPTTLVTSYFERNSKIGPD
ncbi:PREDICTED: putative ribonuclease H protein At1g65750-like [Fragaria vesca subsp. vesca]